MIFDTHIHLDRVATEMDIDRELAAARAAGVGRFLVPGVDRDGWPGIRSIARRKDHIMVAYGLHPMAAAEWNRECRDELRALLQEKNAVAVGEIGLDRKVDVAPELQERVFRDQLQLALEMRLPVLIHCLRETGRMMEILREEQFRDIGGIMHAFSGSYEIAREAIDRGFVLSFGGTLTYPEARRAVEVLEKIPDEAFVVETDAPDMAPHPHRGESNRPVWLKLIVEKVALTRGWDTEKAAEVSSANARRVLKLDSETTIE